MNLPPPHPIERRVWRDPDGNGWNYTSLDNWPFGDCHWTAHLTNALHDAGWQVTEQRRRRAARDRTHS